MFSLVLGFFFFIGHLWHAGVLVPLLLALKKVLTVLTNQYFQCVLDYLF
jgi:hypothetical protein